MLLHCCLAAGLQKGEQEWLQDCPLKSRGRPVSLGRGSGGVLSGSRQSLESEWDRKPPFGVRDMFGSIV